MNIQKIIDFSRNNVKYFKGIIWVICIWILSTLNFYNPDIDNYKNLYKVIGDGVQVRNIERGFCIFIMLANRINLSYNEFIFVFLSIAVFIFLKALIFFDKDIKTPLLLYIIFPFFLDVVQIRNFMAMAITLFSLRFLVRDDWKGICFYIVGILTASAFHSVALCYLVFIFIHKKYRATLCILSVIFIALLVTIFSDAVININFIDRMQKYMEKLLQGTRTYTKILFGSFFMFYYIMLKILNVKGTNIVENIGWSKYKLVYAISKMMFIFLPVTFFDVDFFRIYRNIIPLFNVAICSQIKKQNIANRFFYKTILFIFTIVLFWLFIAAYTFEDVFISILKYNYLWGK